MKKTLTVNLGGTVFHIDEDAYQLLDEYLSNLRLHFQQQEGAEEIVNDIEVRISELFYEIVNNGVQVITIQQVEEIIERMGKPEEMDENEEEEKIHEESTAKKEKTKTKHRLYRNPDDVILGGVLSGLAAYLGWEVTPLRLIVFIVSFFSMGTVFVLYVAFWLVVPFARTASEKLNMRGEEATMENIGKAVTDNFEKVTHGVGEYVKSGKPRNFFQKLGDFTVAVIGFLLKAFLLLFAIVLSPVLFVLAVILVAFIIAIVSLLVGGGTALLTLLPTLGWEPAIASPVVVLVSCISGILLLAIPVASLLFVIFQSVFSWKPMSSGLKWTLFFLWMVSIVIFVLTLAQMSWQFPTVFL